MFATFPQKGNKDIDSYCVSGVSCSTCCAVMDFTITTVTVRPMFQATTWHTAHDESDHAGTTHTGSIGTITLTSIVDSRRNTRFSSSQSGHTTAPVASSNNVRSTLSCHLPQQPPLRYGIGRWRGSVLSAALLDLTSGASRPSLSIRCTGEKAHKGHSE